MDQVWTLHLPVINAHATWHIQFILQKNANELAVRLDSDRCVLSEFDENEDMIMNYFPNSHMHWGISTINGID
jgi:hypothetical protein